jgi:6-phosphogluconolactonase (cycloisomerase 2 family)
MRRRLAAALGLLAALLALGLPAGVAAHDFGRGGSVYTMTNAATGNAVLAYSRAADGSLSLSGTYLTGGLGTGGGLGSQGAVTLSADGQWLAAVDAGSNDVALFAVGPDGGLRLTDTVASGGTKPISVTLHGPLLYVLDAGGNGNIAGFARIFGHLVALPRSIQPLVPAATAATPTSPEEISFSSDGSVLVVAEKGAGLLVTYRVGFLGIAGPPTGYPSAGATPYGFAFDGRNRMFVTEAAGSALSSYSVSRAGVPTVISASVANGEGAACWIALTPDGRYAFTIDAANPAKVSSYAIAPDGSLTLVDAAAGSSATAPLLDASVSSDGRFLYVVDANATASAIDTFSIGPGGSLTPVGSASVAGVGIAAS